MEIPSLLLLAAFLSKRARIEVMNTKAIAETDNKLDVYQSIFATFLLIFLVLKDVE